MKVTINGFPGYVVKAINNKQKKDPSTPSPWNIVNNGWDQYHEGQWFDITYNGESFFGFPIYVSKGYSWGYRSQCLELSEEKFDLLSDLDDYLEGGCLI